MAAASSVSAIPSSSTIYSSSSSAIIGTQLRSKPLQRSVAAGRKGGSTSYPPTTCMAAKGFGAGAKTAKPSVGVKEKEKGRAERSKLPLAASEVVDVDLCSCGVAAEGGAGRKPYKECCGRYHGGVKEPDPVTLLRARYTAFARGLVPYLVRTTHPENPDYKSGGAKQLSADCQETCSRVVFKRLDVGEVEKAEGSDEAFVSFQVVYAYKQGTTTDNQLLVEKSRFVREDDRWYYREKVPTDNVSDSLWKHGALLSEKQEVQSALPKGVFGRAQPKLRPRGR